MASVSSSFQRVFGKRAWHRTAYMLPKNLTSDHKEGAANFWCPRIRPECLWRINYRMAWARGLWRQWKILHPTMAPILNAPYQKKIFIAMNNWPAPAPIHHRRSYSRWSGVFSMV